MYVFIHSPFHFTSDETWMLLPNICVGQICCLHPYFNEENYRTSVKESSLIKIQKLKTCCSDKTQSQPAEKLKAKT